MSPKAFFISIAILLSSVLCVSAQESAHLKFKGIPIDGNYKVFAQKLVQKGFEQIRSTNDGIVLKGTFMAKPDVMVWVIPDPSSKNVAIVSAMIEVGDNWPTIEREYYNIVETYREKYGEPSEHSERFSDNTQDGNFFKLKSIQEGNCYYKTIWEADGGRIAIYPTYYNYEYYIVCSYADEQNYNALQQTIIDDI